MEDCAEITCSICEEIYDLDERKPLLLPCSHSFCRNCIRQMQTNNNSQCPVCRKSWSVQSIDKLPLIRQLADSSENSQNKKFKSDHVARTCNVHNAKFGLWCNTCQESICNHCLIEKHKACDWIHINEKTSQLFKNLQQSATNTRTKLLENFMCETSENGSKLTHIKNNIKKLQHYEKRVKSFSNKLTVEQELAMKKLDEFQNIPQDSSLSTIMSTISEISSLLDDPISPPIIPEFVVPECDEPAHSSDADVTRPTDGTEIQSEESTPTSCCSAGPSTSRLVH